MNQNVTSVSDDGLVKNQPLLELNLSGIEIRVVNGVKSPGTLKTTFKISRAFGAVQQAMNDISLYIWVEQVSVYEAEAPQANFLIF